MFDYESRKEKEPVDPTGLIIAVILGPLFLLFLWLGKAEIGLTVFIVLGMTIFAIKLHWDLRRHIWFWAIIAVILALHIPLIRMVRWPSAYLPRRSSITLFGIADFVIIWGALDLAERLFTRNSSSDNQNG